MAHLTLAFSNLARKPQRRELVHFGSPDRPRLALVEHVIPSPERSKCLKFFSTYLQRERRVSEHTVINYLNDVQQFENWLELKCRGEAGKCLEQAKRDDVQA